MTLAHFCLMDNVWGFPHKDVGASLSENAAMHAASLINSEELCLFFKD